MLDSTLTEEQGSKQLQQREVAASVCLNLALPIYHDLKNTMDETPQANAFRKAAVSLLNSFAPIANSLMDEYREAGFRGNGEQQFTLFRRILTSHAPSMTKILTCNKKVPSKTLQDIFRLATASYTGVIPKDEGEQRFIESLRQHCSHIGGDSLGTVLMSNYKKSEVPASESYNVCLLKQQSRLIDAVYNLQDVKSFHASCSIVTELFNEHIIPYSEKLVERMTDDIFSDDLPGVLRLQNSIVVSTNNAIETIKSMSKDDLINIYDPSCAALIGKEAEKSLDDITELAIDFTTGLYNTKEAFKGQETDIGYMEHNNSAFYALSKTVASTLSKALDCQATDSVESLVFSALEMAAKSARETERACNLLYSGENPSEHVVRYIFDGLMHTHGENLRKFGSLALPEQKYEEAYHNAKRVVSNVHFDVSDELQCDELTEESKSMLTAILMRHSLRTYVELKDLPGVREETLQADIFGEALLRFASKNTLNAMGESNDNVDIGMTYQSQIENASRIILSTIKKSANGQLPCSNMKDAVKESVKNLLICEGAGRSLLKKNELEPSLNAMELN